jgi:hypothetical protein
MSQQPGVKGMKEEEKEQLQFLQPHLAGTHRTPVFSQCPHLSIVLQASFMGAVTRAGGPRGTETVKTPCQVDAGRIIPTGVSS